MRNKLLHAINARDAAEEQLQAVKAVHLQALNDISTILRQVKKELLTTEERKQFPKLTCNVMQANMMREDVAPTRRAAAFYVFVQRKSYEWDRSQTPTVPLPMRKEERDFVHLIQHRLIALGFTILLGPVYGDGNWYRIDVAI